MKSDLNIEIDELKSKHLCKDLTIYNKLLTLLSENDLKSTSIKNYVKNELKNSQECDSKQDIEFNQLYLSICNKYFKETNFSKKNQINHKNMHKIIEKDDYCKIEVKDDYNIDKMIEKRLLFWNINTSENSKILH